ncbi:MAG: hypothetical protein LBM01_00835 [Christensenellaceae bacterium]|jgi:preprotein translocase subunit SecG|nr:hypothetical protein [Christensenellaceae bacterium]
MKNLLLVSQFVADVFPILNIVLVSIMALSCIVIIIAILACPPQSGIGSNAITGANESYYTKNKGSNNEGRIKILIVILASIIALCALLYFISYIIYPNNGGAV